MTKYMTIEQVLDSARTDINNQIEKGIYKGEASFYAINKFYAQWTENPEKTAKILWTMFEEEFLN